MIILALDCATKTGWAVNTPDSGRIESGVSDFSPLRGESKGMRFVKFRSFLKKIFETYPVQMVVYEQAHHRGGAATEIAVGLATRVQEICAELGIEYTTVHTATLKKWACGHGKASKSDMIEKAKKLGCDPQDDNEADAFLILKHSMEKYC